MTKWQQGSGGTMTGMAPSFDFIPLRLQLGPVMRKPIPEDFPVSAQLADSQQAVFHVTGTDAAGQTSVLDTLTAVIDDPAVADVTLGPDGTGLVVAKAPGSGHVAITDTETGGTAVNTGFDVTVTAGEAVAISVSVDAPTDKGAPTPAPTPEPTPAPPTPADTSGTPAATDAGAPAAGSADTGAAATPPATDTGTPTPGAPGDTAGNV